MMTNAGIWTFDDGLHREGHVSVECADDNAVVVRLYADGEQVANFLVDSFAAGVIAGQLAAKAREALVP